MKIKRRREKNKKNKITKLKKNKKFKNKKQTKIKFKHLNNQIKYKILRPKTHK